MFNYLITNSIKVRKLKHGLITLKMLIFLDVSESHP